MLKFVKHNLETISGVEIYPIIGMSMILNIWQILLKMG